MADEDKKEGGGSTAGKDAMAIIGIIVLLIVLWFANGGPQKADLRGIFLAPPAPVGPGNAYGPQVGEPAPYAPQQ